MSNEIQRHERYKQYAKNAYNIGTAKFPKDVKLLGIAENPKTGFAGYVLKENNRIVIVFKGTDTTPFREFRLDAKSDANMAIIKNIPSQTADALELYDKIRKNYPNTPIDVTGHSLGGSLAQYVAVTRKVDEAVCFAPVGIGKSMNDYLIKHGVNAIKTPESRIINYNNPNDVWTMAYRNQLIGTNYTIYSIDQTANQHNLENMKPLSTRKQANPSYRPNPKNYNSHSNFTASNGCAGSYSVSGYTRSDGTKVDGYTRTCGAKHLGMRLEERRAGQEKYKGKRFQNIPLDELEKAIGYFI